MGDRVTLVYPSNLRESIIPSLPPLGLLTVAAPLTEKGIEVCLLDERVEKDFDARLMAELKKDPICVGISSMSGNHIKGALRVSRFIKERSRVPVVWGGVHPSLEPESTAAHPLVDVVVKDDGEETFSRLVEALKNKSPDLRGIRGIGFKERDSVVFTGSADPANIENLPLIPFNLVDFSKYDTRHNWTAGEKIIPIETSRGCPFSCTFCTESVRKKKWRALSPERAVSDIKQYILKYDCKNFDFVDDNFFGTANRGESILWRLISENIGINWYSNIRPGFIAGSDPALTDLIERSGCRMVTFGAESGSERILKMVDKKATTDDIVTASRKMAGRAVRPHFVFIQGFPTETPVESIKTLSLCSKLLLENNTTYVDLPFLIPTPGTVIAEQCWQSNMDRFSLEDHSKSFEFGVHARVPWIKRPPWLSRMTFFFILCSTPVKWLIINTNRQYNPGWLNRIMRFFLRFIQFTA